MRQSPNKMERTPPEVALVSIDMGYGHMRAAHALGSHFGSSILQADRAPLASTREAKHWQRTRTLYEGASRASSFPIAGYPFKTLLQSMTHIAELNPYRDLSAPTLATRVLEQAINAGLGHGMVRHLNESNLPLLTTFYTPALIADLSGLESVYCVVTDVDIHRVWVSSEPAKTAVVYLVPTPHTARRLRAYGVPATQIHCTGFPLPPELLGGPDLMKLRLNLRNRLCRLDPQGIFHQQAGEDADRTLGAPTESIQSPPHLVFAVGGAGAQAELASVFLPSLAPLLRANKLQLTLVAGIREEVRELFCTFLAREGLEQVVDVLWEPTLDDYFSTFNRLLGRADILWTKPSEMTFFSALGLPVLFAPSIGIHETYNQRWATERGAGVQQRDPRFAGEWLQEMLDDGTLAGAAWNGFLRLPKHGVYRTAEVISGRTPHSEASL